jgi:hypothetical protein
MSLDAAGQSVRFVDRVHALLCRIEYRKAASPSEREAIYRQRHRAYLRERAIDPITGGLFTD